MADYVNSYSYQNKVRDLGDAFEIIVKSNPVLSSLFTMRGQAINTKHEWLEDTIAPQGTILSGAYTSGDGTLTVNDTGFAKVGDILIAKESNGASTTVQWQVDSVDSATQLSVSVYGGSTDQNVGANAEIRLISRPRGESTNPDYESGKEPTAAYNFTQIFDRTAQVSKTAEAVRMYGIDDTLDYQVQNMLQYIAYELNNTAIYGRRVQRSGSSKGTMGGLLYFLENGTGNKVDATSNAITTAIINDAFEQAVKNGGTGIDTVLCGTNQARKISGFNTSGNNPIVTRDERQAGSYVQSYVSDLPIGGGMVSQIVVDQNFPADKIALIDSSKLAMMPLRDRDFFDQDATPQGADFFSRRILGEYTVEIKNASEAHVLIENLAL